MILWCPGCKVEIRWIGYCLPGQEPVCAKCGRKTRIRIKCTGADKAALAVSLNLTEFLLDNLTVHSPSLDPEFKEPIELIRLARVLLKQMHSVMYTK